MEKMKLRLTILTLSMYFFMTSCNPEESLNKQELNLEAYSLLKENLKKDLSITGSQLKGIKGEKRRMLALDVAKNYYGEETKQYDAFQMAFHNINAPKNATKADGLASGYACRGTTIFLIAVFIVLYRVL
jgi:hypothetical protein